jgi:hypothetical protein
MENIIIATESQLTAIIENAVRKALINNMGAQQKDTEDTISGCRGAAKFLNEIGYKISLSVVYKQASIGGIPCQRFRGRGLVFSRHKLLEWAKNSCKEIGDMSEITLTLAEAANDKLRRGRISSTGAK